MVSYPGNKSGFDLGLTQEYPEVYDFFLGSGGFIRAANQVGADWYGAEANPAQEGLMRAVNTEWPGMAEEILEGSRELAKEMRSHLDPSWDGKGTYSALFPESHKAIKSIWEARVKRPWDLYYELDMSIPESMIAQVMVGTYGYGGNVRVSKNGLNVPFNAQKLRTANPVLPRKLPGVAKVICDSYDQLKPTEGSLCLIDPPYWLPKGYKNTHQKCTACYPGHKPYDPDGLKMYIEPLWASVYGEAQTILVTGYYSHTLEDVIQHYSEEYSITATNLGALATQGHRHRQTHGKRSVNSDLPKPEEFIWRLERIHP